MKLADTAPATVRETPYSIASDVIGFKNLFVNYYVIGQPGEGNTWWLVDAGLPGSARAIIREAERLFGKEHPPEGIILTHGHFDHVGALPRLLKKWPEINVFAHPFEIPYLTGEDSYPPPDPSAGGGAMSRMSWLFPVKPVDLGSRIKPLDEGMDLAHLEEWTIVHTPGHTPGHVSLYRERDGRLIAGDAFVTTNQNSLLSVLTQKREIHAPPAYFTINWREAKNSIQKLNDLDPDAAGTGHGFPVFGEDLREGLQKLMVTFEAKELPADGHYVKHPVPVQSGRTRTTGSPKSYRRALALGKTTAGLAAGLGVTWLVNKLRKQAR